jgi:hypothetical protein
MSETEGMLNFPYPLCKLPTGGSLLEPSGIVAYVKGHRDEAGCVERQALIREMLRHEGRPESDCSASPRRESGRAGLILESSMQCSRMSSDVIGNSLGENL